MSDRSTRGPAAARLGPWLTRPPSDTARARIFLLPYAGCGAGLYRNWPDRWDGVDLVPVELPGRETRLAEPVAGSFEDLATAMAEGLLPWFDRPFAFFGHCWAALPAYEVTWRLEHGPAFPPSQLYVSSQLAPQDGPVGRMLGMDHEEMAEELRTTIRALGAQPHPELVELYVEVLGADVAASRRYRVPSPRRLSCPITAIGWSRDEEVRPEQMRGWPLCGSTEFLLLDGDHHRFLDPPADLLDALTAPLRPGAS